MSGGVSEHIARWSLWTARSAVVAFQPSVTLFLQGEQGVFRPASPGFAWRQPMSINHLLPEHVSFGPDEVKVLSTAFDAALRELGLDRSDPAALSREADHGPCAAR
jgi:hypothetical protein